MAVYRASICDSTDRIHSWSPDGDILTLSTTHSGPIKVHLDRIKPAVDSLFTNLITALSSLLPHQMEFPSEVALDLHDDLEISKSFVDQDSFLDKITPLYTQFEASMRSPDESSHQIWSGNKFQPKNFKTWLALEQKALEQILLILLFTGGGISPRTSSVAALQFRPTSERRNLYLLNQSLCFVWPKAKANSRSNSGSSDSLYAYPPQLNWSLFIYLGVIRRFTIAIISEQSWSLGAIETTLFVYSGMADNRGTPWTSAFMNSTLGGFSEHVFDSQCRVSDLRQLTQSIYSLHFQRCEEMEGIMEETANRMGNHTKAVAIRYYGKAGATREEWAQFCTACSRAWHCWLGLISYDHIIGLHLGDIPILQRRRNQVVAELSAIIWIKDHRSQILKIEGVQDFFDRLQLKVSLNICYTYIALKLSFIRRHQNISSSARSLHLYSGVEKVHHS
jgi:hypothetical protein